RCASGAATEGDRGNRSPARAHPQRRRTPLDPSQPGTGTRAVAAIQSEEEIKTPGCLNSPLLGSLAPLISSPVPAEARANLLYTAPSATSPGSASVSHSNLPACRRLPHVFRAWHFEQYEDFVPQHL